MLALLRVMFPYMTLACLAAVFMGMLNSRGYFFIPAMGTQNCERLLIVLSGLSALFVLAWPLRAKAGALFLAAAAVAVVLLAMSVSGVPSMLIAYGRRITTSAKSSEILYAGEGMNASIAISRWNDGAVQFHVSGKVEASTEPYDMRLQRMLGHMPALLHPNPRSVLVVGFGAGVTAGSFVLHPEVKRIVICEIRKCRARSLTSTRPSRCRTLRISRRRSSFSRPFEGMVFRVVSNSNFGLRCQHCQGLFGRLHSGRSTSAIPCVALHFAPLNRANISSTLRWYTFSSTSSGRPRP